MNTISDSDARAAIARIPKWYHSIEFAPGIVTPGVFDLRSVIERLPWPDVRGRRCLDVGTADGFLAFELERRGAAEVVAVDIPTYESWDWEFQLTTNGPEYMRLTAGETPGAGFTVARDLLRSSVQRETLTIYELSPDALGEFDVVVCGSLLLHLRDPLRALGAIRSVCRDLFLCTNQVELARSLRYRRQPLIRLDGTSGLTQWWLPNVAGHRQLLLAAGFDLVRESGTYSIPFGPGHEPRARRPRRLLSTAARRVLTGNDGVPHHAILARPRSS